MNSHRSLLSSSHPSSLFPKHTHSDTKAHTLLQAACLSIQPLSALPSDVKDLTCQLSLIKHLLPSPLLCLVRLPTYHTASLMCMHYAACLCSSAIVETYLQSLRPGDIKRELLFKPLFTVNMETVLTVCVCYSPTECSKRGRKSESAVGAVNPSFSKGGQGVAGLKRYTEPYRNELLRYFHSLRSHCGKNCASPFK